MLSGHVKFRAWSYPPTVMKSRKMPGLTGQRSLLCVPAHSLVLLDRNFLAANVLLPLQSGAPDRHWLTRAKSTTKWQVVRRLGPGDWLVEMTVSSAARRQNPALRSVCAKR